MYLTPFVVFLDHKKEAIVICIRGMIAMEVSFDSFLFIASSCQSFFLQDVLTCLTCSPASWTACDGDSSYYVNSVRYFDNVLPQAMKFCDYRACMKQQKRSLMFLWKRNYSLKPFHPTG